MKIGISGSRKFDDYEKFKECFLSLNLKVTALVSGAAKGTDTLARRLAEELKVPLVEFKPDYSRYGRGAPLVRNKLIAEECDFGIAFVKPDSRGTLNFIEHMKSLHKPLRVFKV